MARQPDAAKERRWLERIRAWQQSQLSVRAFCQRRCLSEASFYGWRRLLSERGLIDECSVPAAVPTIPTPTFVQVAVNAAAGAVPAIDLVLAGGRIVRLRPGFDADLLRQLLRLLEEPSC
jgi:hypothetical protein